MASERTRDLSATSTCLAVNETVLDVAQDLRQELASLVSAECLFNDDVRPIAVDAGQLTTALWTLVDNAVEAMDGPGTIVFETRNLLRGDLDDGRGGEWVEIAVCDNGCGMSEGLRLQLMNSFAAPTADAGEMPGSGLGMVSALMARSGGYLVLESEAGTGTTVRLRFPRSLEAGQSPSRSGHAPRRMLVVEDFGGVRAVTMAMLEIAGYVVTGVSTAREAVAVMHGQAFDVLISDVRLGPGMDGVALARHAQQVDPSMAVVLMSGFTAQHFNLGSLPGDWHFLQKPFSSQELMLAVAEAARLARTARSIREPQ